MATTPQNEEPGFEADVNELSGDKDPAKADTLEDEPHAEDGSRDEMGKAPEAAADARKEGGYQ